MACDDCIADGPGVDLTRPADHQGHALSALVDPPFSFAERRVVGRRLASGPLAIALNRLVERVLGSHIPQLRIVQRPAMAVAAVVREEDEQRVVGQSSFSSLASMRPRLSSTERSIEPMTGLRCSPRDRSFWQTRRCTDSLCCQGPCTE